MAETKGKQGRPKKQHVNVAEPAKNKATSIEIEPDVEIHSAKETKVIEVKTEKVTEAKTAKQKTPKLPVSVRKNNTFDVIVKGKLRSMSKQAYEAVSKDPQLKVTLPKGSPLAVNLQAPKKPCKDC